MAFLSVISSFALKKWYKSNLLKKIAAEKKQLLEILLKVNKNIVCLLIAFRE